MGRHRLAWRELPVLKAPLRERAGGEEIMENDVTSETLQSLAAANGLTLPVSRLDRVLKQYRIYLQLLARLDAFELPMDAEPQTLVTLAPETPTEQQPRATKGDAHGNR